jgi:GDP-L-fucose synthase
MRRYASEELVNVGWGTDISIRELAQLVAEVVGFGGTLHFDHSKPDGTPRKLLDVSRLSSLGWAPQIPLAEGIAATYEWFRAHPHDYRG